jgi:repressor LexA
MRAEENRPAKEGKPKGVRIPVYGAVAAGIPIEAIEDIVDYEEIDQELAATGEFFGLRIKGSSMEPRICEGDVVIVRRQADADTGDVAIVIVNGYNATVKRIKKETTGITLIPFNPAYEVRYYSAEDVERLPVRIIGKVVELRGKF